MSGKGFLSGEGDHYGKCLWESRMTKTCLRDNEEPSFQDFWHFSLWHKQLQSIQCLSKILAPIGSKMICPPSSRTAVKEHWLECTGVLHLSAQSCYAFHWCVSFFYCFAWPWLLISTFTDHQKITQMCLTFWNTLVLSGNIWSFITAIYQVLAT